MNDIDFGFDSIYEHTRNRGKPGTVTIAGEPTTAVDGTKTRTDQVVNVRWLTLQKTEFSRVIANEAVQQRVGASLFIFYLPDVQADFTQLKEKDWIDFRGQRYNVKTSSVEDTALVVTADLLQEA